MSHGRRPNHGAEIVAASSGAILGLVAITLGLRGVDEGALGAVLRLTARTSLALFLAAFVAAPLRALWPSPATRWLLAHRRYLGISFALSHLVHAALIGVLALHTDGRSLAGRGADLVGGGIVYAFLVFMLATSFDRTAAAVGPRVWRIGHTLGAYLIWAAFASSLLLRATESPRYIPLAMLPPAALALRVIAGIRRRRHA